MFEFDDMDFSMIMPDDTDLFGVENSGVVKPSCSEQKSDSVKILKDAMKERLKEKLSPHISPVNASIIKEFIPQKGGHAFFLMNGNCQFVDFIREFLACFKSKADAVFLTTLSANDYTFQVLDELFSHIKVNLLISTYYLATDKANTLPRLKEAGKLGNYDIGFFRNHTKLILIKIDGRHFVFSGSANLRSSATIEQFSIFDDREIYEFNEKWISHLIQKYNFDRGFKAVKYTGPGNFDFVMDIEGF